MKTVSIFFAVSLLFSTIISAQTVSDFTVKDLDGETHNLFSYLEDGKHVLIEIMMFD